STALHIREGAPPDTLDRVRKALEARVTEPGSGIREVLDAPAAAALGSIDVPLVLNAREGWYFSDGATGDWRTPTTSKGGHGFAPNRDEMRSSLVLAGPGLARKGDLGVVPMTSIAPTLGRVLGVTLDPRAGPPLP